MAINFEKASADELRRFAKSVGVELSNGASREQIVAQLQKEAGGNVTQGAVFEYPDAKKARRVRVLIPQSENPALNHPVPVTVNGFRVEIERGADTEVPEFIANALTNCVETHFVVTNTRDENGNLVYQEINRPRFHQQVAA